MPHLQQQHYHLINAMAYQQPIGTVVQLLTDASKEVVIAIWIHNALDAWFVAPIIALVVLILIINLSAIDLMMDLKDSGMKLMIVAPKDVHQRIHVNQVFFFLLYICSV